MLLLRNARGFAALPHWKQWLLLRAFVSLTIIRVALWVTRFEKVRGFIRGPRRFEREFRSQAQINHISWAIAASSPFVPKATCLVKALAAQMLLNQHGRHSELHIGVAKSTENGLLAHAWVECDGKIVVGDNGSESYSRLHRFKTGDPL